jgi:hypothetical protein
LRSDLLAQIVTDGEPDVLAFPMNADLTMPAVELDGALSHDDYYGELLRCNRALVFYLQSYLGRSKGAPAQEARAMLDKAIAALMADQAVALAMFSEGEYSS